MVNSAAAVITFLLFSQQRVQKNANLPAAGIKIFWVLFGSQRLCQRVTHNSKGLHKHQDQIVKVIMWLHAGDDSAGRGIFGLKAEHFPPRENSEFHSFVQPG